MKRSLFIISVWLLATAGIVKVQVAIGTTLPRASSAPEVQSVRTHFFT